jgi:hypothetical protein
MLIHQKLRVPSLWTSKFTRVKQNRKWLSLHYSVLATATYSYYLSENSGVIHNIITCGFVCEGQLNLSAPVQDSVLPPSIIFLKLLHCNRGNDLYVIWNALTYVEQKELKIKAANSFAINEQQYSDLHTLATFMSVDLLPLECQASHWRHPDPTSQTWWMVTACLHRHKRTSHCSTGSHSEMQIRGNCFGKPRAPGYCATAAAHTACQKSRCQVEVTMLMLQKKTELTV